MTDPFSCLDLKHMWHLARVLWPRRSQHGGWVWGLVWRRHDGARWRYKRWSALERAGRAGRRQFRHPRGLTAAVPP